MHVYKNVPSLLSLTSSQAPCSQSSRITNTNTDLATASTLILLLSTSCHPTLQYPPPHTDFVTADPLVLHFSHAAIFPPGHFPPTDSDMWSSSLRCRGLLRIKQRQLVQEQQQQQQQIKKDFGIGQPEGDAAGGRAGGSGGLVRRPDELAAEQRRGWPSGSSGGDRGQQARHGGGGASPGGFSEEGELKIGEAGGGMGTGGGGFPGSGGSGSNASSGGGIWPAARQAPGTGQGSSFGGDSASRPSSGAAKKAGGGQQNGRGEAPWLVITDED